MDNNDSIKSDLIIEEDFNFLNFSSYPSYPVGTQMSGVLEKSQIESFVRIAYKNYRKKGDRFRPYLALKYDKDNRIEVLNRFLLSNPPIFRLEEIRGYLKGERKQKRLLIVTLNPFDEHQHKTYDMRFDFLLFGLLMDKVLLISYLDHLKEKKPNDFKALKWNLNELQITKLHAQLVENNIIDNEVSVGEFYQVFNNYVAIFDKSIPVNPMNLACLLYWCKEKKYLETLQPFKIIEQMKMFCTKKGKVINAHNLNRYISEYKEEFRDGMKCQFCKIKEILDCL